MPYQKSTAVAITSPGQMISQPCIVTALGLLAGADAATIKFYDSSDGTATGDSFVWALGAGIGISDKAIFPEGIRFIKGVFAVTTGTTPIGMVAIEQSRSNQVALQ